MSETSPSAMSSDESDLKLRRFELEIRQKQIELPIRLAHFGLVGSLTGALAGAIMMIVLAFIGAKYPELHITGNHLCILGAEICASVVFFGAFVFQRSFQIVVDKNNGITAGAPVDQAKTEANRGESI